MASSSNHTSSDSESPPPRSGNKRRAKTLLDTLADGGRKKRKSPLAEENLRRYARAAQWFTRSYSPFTGITEVIHHGLHEGEVDDDDDSELQNIEDLTEYINGYKHILSYESNFKAAFERLKDDIPALEELVRVMDAQAKEVRTGDTGTLKHGIVALLPKNLTTDVVMPPLPKSLSKANRGYNHPQIARMLCPRDHLADFDSDASVIDQLQAGSISTTPGDWATFLYDEEVEYDVENPAQGLFRGYLVIRVAKHIFTSPSSASKSKAGAGKSTRASNAKIHGMKRFTPRTIAYAVVQTWFTLSSMEAWDAEAEGFSLLELFNLTVEQFEDDPQSEWAVSTLAFFDEHVFGRRSPAVPEVAEEPAARRETAAERMKRIRAKAKATPVSSGSNSSG